MIILDTNVLSALMYREETKLIRDWLNRQRIQDIWFTAISFYEIDFGIQLAPEGKRKVQLAEIFQSLIRERLSNRILPYDTAAARATAELAARRQRAGLSKDLPDTMIAGIVIAKRATLATRNISDFSDLPGPVVNPWGD